MTDDSKKLMRRFLRKSWPDFTDEQIDQLTADTHVVKFHYPDGPTGPCHATVEPKPTTTTTEVTP